MFKLFAAITFVMHSTLVFADLDRAGNVIYEPWDDGPSTGWVLVLVFFAMVWLAWSQSEKRTKERILAREEIDNLKKQLWEAKKTSEGLDLKLKQSQRMLAVVDQYLDGELTDDEFFQAADHIRATEEVAAEKSDNWTVHRTATQDLEDLMQAIDKLKNTGLK